MGTFLLRSPYYSAMAILVLFVALIAGMGAEKFCCAPEKFSAQTIVKTYRDGAFFQGTGEVVYDFAAGMHAAFFNITVDEYRGIYSLTSTHFDVNTGFVYTMTAGSCSKEKIDDSWLKEITGPHCIPKIAKLESSFAFGGPHEDVELDRYVQPIPDGQRQMVVTSNHCSPVQEVYFSGSKTDNGFNMKGATMITLGNLKLKVEDPSVFVLPDMCEKTVLSSKRNNDKNLPVDPWKFVPLLAAF